MRVDDQILYTNDLRYKNITNKKYAVSATYDFSINGGGIGTINLSGKVLLPTNIIVAKVLTYEFIPLTATGASNIVIKIGNTALTGDIAFDTGFTGGADNQTIVPAGGLLITNSGAINWQIKDFALTAGKINVYIDFYIVD